MSIDAPPDIIDIIDIIDDDTDIFGDRSANDQRRDSGGPRWVGPIAAGVLVALIGYGVVTSASSSGVPTVAPVTSTSVATTTPPPVPSTAVATTPPPPVPYYAADPPREFTVQYVDMHTPRAGNSSAGHYELWATEGANAVSGSWFSLDAHAGGTPVYEVNAYRRQAGALPITISHRADGHTITQFSPHGNSAVTITSFGWDDDALARLAASINTRGNSVEFADDWFASDHRRLSFVQPWFAVQGLPLEQVSYVALADPSVSVAITVAQRPPPKQGGATLDRQIALRFFLNDAQPFEVDDHSALAGSLIGDRDYALASWIDGQSIVTVGADMPVPQLIAIARTVHQVSAAEWKGMKFQSIRTVDSGANYEQSANRPVSFGVDAGSHPWKIQAAMGRFGSQRLIGWSWGGSGGSTTAGATAQINTVVQAGRTFVLADLPRAVAAGGELHVLRDGLEPVVVAFNDVDPEFDRTVAAYAFSEAVPYTAQIIGPDGAVLANWWSR